MDGYTKILYHQKIPNGTKEQQRTENQKNAQIYAKWELGFYI